MDPNPILPCLDCRTVIFSLKIKKSNEKRKNVPKKKKKGDIVLTFHLDGLKFRGFS